MRETREKSSQVYFFQKILKMEAVDEPLFQEVLNEVSCKSSNPLTLSLFADRVELASEEPKCCRGGKRSLDDGDRNIIRVPFDKIIGCHVLNSSMAICDEGESQQSSSHLGIYAFQEEFVHMKQKRGKTALAFLLRYFCPIRA